MSALSAPLRIGKYTVKIALRPDNPAFPRFEIYAGKTFIAASFSMVDEAACRWLEMHSKNGCMVYADSSVPCRGYRRGRPRKAA